VVFEVSGECLEFQGGMEIGTMVLFLKSSVIWSVRVGSNVKVLRI
jgi:hypothetical protein